jgi:hypothetical protein
MEIVEHHESIVVMALYELVLAVIWFTEFSNDPALSTF